MLRFIGIAFALFFRVPLMVTLGVVVFTYEYLCAKHDERVELRYSSPSILVPAAGFISAFAVLEILEKTGFLWVYSRMWSCVHNLATRGRRRFPGFFPPHTLKVLKTMEDGLPLAIITTLVVPLVIVYKLLVPWLLKHLCDPLFRGFVPTFYLSIHRQHYQNLDPNLPTIRLIELLPGQPLEPITCRLIEASVNDAEFEAVSYAWGGHLVLRRHILVNGKRFWVTQNVFLALQTFRLTDQGRTLWIDQLCINQYDINEKADQVTHKMHHIYRNAKRVIAWLGASTPDISWAFQQAKLYPDMIYDGASGFKIEVERSRSVEGRRYCDAWQDIFLRKWFRRTWVVQEAALARHMVVMCGTDEMDWQTLKQTALNLKRLHKLEVTPHSGALLEFVDGLGGGRKTLSLLDLLIRFRRYEVTDARDKLIGFLALAEDGHQYPDIHYRYSSDMLFANFTAAYIERTQSLAILALAEARTAPFIEGLACSWTLDWGQGEALSSRSKILWGASFESSTISRVAKYSACGNRPAICRREPGTSNQGIVRGIFLRGWYVDTVKAVSARGNSYEVSSFLPIWEEFAKRRMPCSAASSKLAFESLILAEVYELSESIPWSKWYVASHRRSSNAHSDVQQLAEEASSILENLCGRRRMFVTMKGKLGVGPAATGPGDHVCVFEGGAVPFLIRKWRDMMRIASAGKLFDSKFDHRRPHHLVGQAVVSGIMYASEQQIEEQIETGVIKTREILLR